MTSTSIAVGRPNAIVISYSELDTFKQCPHKHQLSYIERWTQPRDERSAAGRGTLWHKMLDAHYTAIKTGDAKPQQAVADELHLFRQAGKDPEVLDLLEWMYSGYVETWGLDPEWEIIAIEYKAVVPLKYANGRMSRFDLKMVIDLVVRDRASGRIWLIDHKSHAEIPKDKDLDLDDQFGLYTWGLRELGHTVFGAIYNTARTKRNKGDHPELVEEWRRRKAAGEKPGAEPKPQPIEGRYDRHLMSRTPIEVDKLASEALDTARTMYSSYNFHERHTNTDTCKWRCDYTEACLLGRKSTDARERAFLGDIGFAQDFRRH